jgi:hypothetical protein
MRVETVRQPFENGRALERSPVLPILECLIDNRSIWFVPRPLRQCHPAQGLGPETTISSPLRDEAGADVLRRALAENAVIGGSVTRGTRPRRPADPPGRRRARSG